MPVNLYNAGFFYYKIRLKSLRTGLCSNSAAGTHSIPQTFYLDLTERVEENEGGKRGDMTFKEGRKQGKDESRHDH